MIKEIRKQTMNESEEKIQKQTESKPSEKPQEIPNLQKQIDKTFHTPKNQIAIAVIMILGMLLLGVVMLFQQITLYGMIFCLAAIVIISLAIYGINFAKKGITVSDELKNYMDSFSSEQFFSARDMERLPAQPGIIEVSKPMEYQQGNRYGIIRQHVDKSVYVGFAVSPLGLAIAAPFTSPYVWYMAAITGIGMAVVAWLYYIFNTGEMTYLISTKKRFSTAAAAVSARKKPEK